ncbi:cysteine desulfurase-like protein [Ancylobacter lacus]|uniref:cysteine desulfurase-like protein n=1 Tax=Ancylobacter lacus TaxID=2579970 RepID=UPI001BCF756A|nr:cysteine desulfurase-like protein [Ancylobacter lacus]MBS7538107.1 cysteine desulfurase-like protein [Ancylobacter lacus]
MAARWDMEAVRAAFPGLAVRDEGRARLYADAPAGTQVAARCLERMNRALVESCANDGGSFRTSRAAEALMLEAHAGAGALFNAGADEIVFGLNTTSLFFAFAYMLSRDWKTGDEIVLTRMDHDANVAPWLTMAQEKGVTVRWLDFSPESFEYDYAALDGLIGPRTRLVACSHASNLLGTINDVARIVAAGRAAGAVTVVDAVQSAPHLPVDVKAIGCDILCASAYKFFGPHAAVLYLAPALRDRLTPLKVRPSPAAMPWRFAPGTPSFEAQAGTLGAIEHMAGLGATLGGADPAAPLRERIVAGYAAAIAHEAELMRVFLDGAAAIPGLTLYGLSSPNRLEGRVPTFSFRLPGKHPAAVAQALADENIFAWAGSFYAQEAAGRLGIGPGGGVNRVGLAHYNTADEVRRLLGALAAA